MCSVCYLLIMGSRRLIPAFPSRILRAERERERERERENGQHMFINLHLSFLFQDEDDDGSVDMVDKE